MIVPSGMTTVACVGAAATRLLDKASIVDSLGIMAESVVRIITTVGGVLVGEYNDPTRLELDTHAHADAQNPVTIDLLIRKAPVRRHDSPRHPGRLTRSRC